MPIQPRTAPRYDLLFAEGTFNGTLLIGPDPLGKTFDYGVFMEARRRLKLNGMKMTDSKRGIEEYEKYFNFQGTKIKARLRLVHGRNYGKNLQELWRDALTHDDLIYLKTHAGYGKHLSLSDDVSYFTDALKEMFNDPDRKPYQLFYLDCCKSEMYYRDIFREYVGGGIDLILHKWFCDYRKIAPVIALIKELMDGSDVERIISKMNEEYGIVHFDQEDAPEDRRLDRKMMTFSFSQI
ncbi:MAG: hypothetical protein OIN87_12290 [Candidatus Methanoperedens sp.]|nr:hypothetical protein [Candidatus Methanoperedens sp.]